MLTTASVTKLSSGVYYQLEDVLRAIKHVRDNAAMYGVDPSKIAVWGDSAGGSLAMRAAGTGKSGAAAAVGWSAPTNAYTAIFKSPQAFAIGMDHSTCVPTDLNGVMNAIDMLNGGEGNIPNEGGLGNNSIDSFVNGDTLGAVTEVLTLAERAQRTGTAASSLSSGISGEGEGSAPSEQNVRQLTSKKYLECIDNFNSASPALFASPLTPPTFLAGFETDILIDPGQLYQMRDKLRGMGVPSDVITLPGVASPVTVGGENHLDYNEAFVKPSLDFLDKFLRPAANK
ncbi:alpha/beta hydrolase [Candidatus Saccharibacteria bacterium]|nr:alpha/beta hydrolase [Candidatus Saccharibacteria bacterium]